MVYFGTCIKFRGQYVGKTTKKFKARHSGHKHEIKNNIGGLGHHYGRLGGKGIATGRSCNFLYCGGTNPLTDNPVLKIYFHDFMIFMGQYEYFFVTMLIYVVSFLSLTVTLYLALTSGSQS